MVTILSKSAALLSKFCAKWPIHIIIGTTLMASILYLSILDYYSSILSSDSSAITFYHPPGSSDYQDWVKVENLSNHKYESAQHLALIPVTFNTFDNQHELPLDSELFHKAYNENERVIITNFSDYQVALESVRTLVSNDGTVWKIRNQNRIGRYYDYLKHFPSKLYDLVSGAEPLDILLISLAYIAMWFSFVQLFIEMRKYGSSFWTAFGSLLSSGFAFLFSLAFTTQVLNISIPLVSLSEGIPFLVVIIGFKHKIAFTAPVLKAIQKDLTKDVPTTISTVVRTQSASPLIRDHIFISSSFLICSYFTSSFPGLRNFCILCATILLSDLLFTFTFFASILSLKAQINTVHKSLEIKQLLEEDGISDEVAESVAASSQSYTPIFQQNRNIATFKIAMVASFIGIHFFALGTSWLFDNSITAMTANLKPFHLFSSTLTDSLSKSIAKNIPINSTGGTLVTVFQSEVYMPTGFLFQLEDSILKFFTILSETIVDPFISKFLFLLAGISVSINVYLLNATKLHLDFDEKHSKSRKSQYSSKEEKNSSEPSAASTSVSVLSSEPKISKIKSRSNIAQQSQVGADIKEAQIIEESESEVSSSSESESATENRIVKLRPLDELIQILKDGNVKDCENEEIVKLTTAGKLPLYSLEKQLGDKTRAVLIRRRAIAILADAPVLNSRKLPYKHYDYDRVFGACCENVIGYMPIPVGVAGPMIIDGVPYHIPMATTEGCLVASTMRGCKAINSGGGVTTILTSDGMTRGPVVSFPTLSRVGAAKTWLDSEEGQKTIKKAFNSTSRFARLQHIKTAIAGTLMFLRFKTTTGDAMGMNMISKGVEFALKYMIEECGFEDMDVISLSGNYCIDKKPAAINWIEGRGKGIVAEARIPKETVQKTLKSDVDALVELNIDKNLIGSAMAGSVGGFNAQAANLVTAIYLVTGQDPAQNVESSNCITLMKKLPNGDLSISVSMPSIEVGTIGGGTVLDPQGSMLELLGVKGPHPTEPGKNARQLARIVASAVLAAELSLCSALAAGHLVQSHMTHNRASNKGPNATATATPAPASITAAAPSSTNSTSASSTPSTSAPSSADIKRLQKGSKICIRS